MTDQTILLSLVDKILLKSPMDINHRFIRDRIEVFYSKNGRNYDIAVIEVIDTAITISESAFQEEYFYANDQEFLSQIESKLNKAYAKAENIMRPIIRR